jgi:hypothetical protein
MRGKPSAAPSNADLFVSDWIDLYVSGHWTLAEFEAHLEAMLPKFTHEDWLPRRKRSGKPRTAKQAAEAWQAPATQSSANYAVSVSAFTSHTGAA